MVTLIEGALGASPSYNGPHPGTPRFCYHKSLGILRSVRGYAARPYLRLFNNHRSRLH